MSAIAFGVYSCGLTDDEGGSSAADRLLDGEDAEDEHGDRIYAMSTQQYPLFERLAYFLKGSKINTLNQRAVEAVLLIEAGSSTMEEETGNAILEERRHAGQ